MKDRWEHVLKYVSLRYLLLVCALTNTDDNRFRRYPIADSSNHPGHAREGKDSPLTVSLSLQANVLASPTIISSHQYDTHTSSSTFWKAVAIAIGEASFR